MAVTFNDYKEALKKYGNRKPLLKVQFLRREDETPLKEVTTDLRLDGGININNGNGVRRSMKLTLDNISKEYFPSLDSGIWVASKIKAFIGMVVNGEEVFIPHGVFVVDDPQVNEDKSVTINTVDKYSLLDGSLGGEVDSIIIIPPNTSVDIAVRTLMTISQDPNPPIIEVELGNELIPYEIVVEEGETIGSILEEIAFSYSANIFYNEEGFLTLESDLKDGEKGSVWDFDGDIETEKNYQEGNVQYKLSEVYNRVLVIGDNINGSIIRAVVENNSLLSDTSIPNIGFSRTLVIKDDIIYNNKYATERGIYELKRATNALTESSVKTLPIYHLDVDKVVTISDSRLGVYNRRGLVQSIFIPFTVDSTMNLKLVDTFDMEF